jgi:homogentisate 1,2-dioxygenase
MLVQRGTPLRGGDNHEGLIRRSYTRKGFFGTFATLTQTRDLGRPIRADRELTPQPIAVDRVVTDDLERADGLPTPLLSNGEVTIALSRRREPMPFCWRNADADELYFIHRGHCRFETEFGELLAEPGDFIYLGRNVIYRVVPLDQDNLHLIVQTHDLLEPAEQYHRAHGMTGSGLDLSQAVLPELSSPSDTPTAQAEYEVRACIEGKLYSAFFDFDPVGVTVGWVGDPVVFKLSAWKVGAAFSPFTPPTNAVFMTETRDCVVNVRRPTGVHIPPGHSNDFDELWFLHSASEEPKVVPGIGVLRWLPQGWTHAMFASPVPAAPDPHYLDFNVDVRRRLKLSPAAERSVEATLAVLDAAARW